MSQEVMYSPWCPIEGGIFHFKDQTHSRSAVVRLTDAEAAQVRKLGMDPAAVARHMPPRKKRPDDGPLHLTDAEAAEIRRLGYNPDLIARMNEAHSPAMYQSLKREVEGGAR